ncbi:MAG: tRNA uridine-5-carboxymethylaminomethyl(34) synthesis GTPase MnmE [Bacteroidales bacterium]
MDRRSETICAPATGEGGAISVIRVSGSNSINICSSIFQPSVKGKNLTEAKGYTIIHGEIVDYDDTVDEVLLSVFRSPNSYTGEDSVEISCHASSFIRQRILKLLIDNGAIAAQPGEFTQRAFMNGRLDLSQAEAVADLIASSSEASHRLAIKQMKGGFSTEISLLRAELLNFVSLIELELDFGEEDVEFADRNELLGIITNVRSITGRLATSFILGNAIKNGIPVAITGRPNSGKSTLLNLLLKEERAIVSDIPGTTRDFIEDTMVIDSIRYRFIDTAGLRETEDLIESLGIEKTKEKIAQSSVVLLVEEAGDSPEVINNRISQIRDIIADPEKKLILVINKSDLVKEDYLLNLNAGIRKKEGEELLFISALKGEGIDNLRSVLRNIVDIRGKYEEDIVITNIRHYQALNNVSASLSRVEEGLKTGLAEDLLAVDIRQAIHYLGEITGEITTDEILGNIFKNFCIGK